MMYGLLGKVQAYIGNNSNGVSAGKSGKNEMFLAKGFTQRAALSCTVHSARMVSITHIYLTQAIISTLRPRSFATTK
jgi:hypothetical protein